MRAINTMNLVLSALLLAATLACGGGDGGGNGDFGGGNGDFGGGDDDFGGGDDDFGGGGGGGGGDDTGDSCREDSDCNTGCLFAVEEGGGQTDFGYCTKRCESFSDCPTFWDCEEVGNAAGTYCVQ